MQTRDNNVKNGFLAYPEVAQQLAAGLTPEVLEAAIPSEVLKGIKRVVITGNGDSYAASMATQEFNSKMFGQIDYYALRCVDVSRHFVFPQENRKETLVVVISVSGGGSRVTEAMKRAAAKGCTTLAITGNPESRMAKEAEYILKIQVPKGEGFSPANQTRSYFSTLFAVLSLGLHAGKAKGVISAQEQKDLQAQMCKYVSDTYCEEVLGRVDDQIEKLADSWKDYLGYDFVGGGVDFAGAYFGAAKFFELCGSLNCLNDCEDWCHIDYFQTKRDQLGTVMVATKNCASFSRSVETVGSMQKSQRNVLVVTDAEADAFIPGVTVCTIPSAPCAAFTPLTNFIPLCMLANYIALKRGYPYFGGMDDSNPLFSQTGNINTIKSSEIVMVD